MHMLRPNSALAAVAGFLATVVVSSASAVGTTLTMPAHQAGDLLIGVGMGKSTTSLTTAAGWCGVTDAFNPATTRDHIAYKVATSSAETFGTWTGATAVWVGVYRKDPALEWWVGRLKQPAAPGPTQLSHVSAQYNASSTTITYPNLTTPTEVDADLWLLRLAIHTVATNMLANTPTGWTRRSGDNTGISAMDTNGVVLGDANSVGGNTQTVGTSGNSAAITLMFGVRQPRQNVWMLSAQEELGFTSVFNGPPSYKSGDLVVVRCDVNGTLATPPAGAGWTALNSAETTGTRTSRWYYKVMTADSSASGSAPNLGTWTGQSSGIVTSWAFRKAAGKTWNTPTIATQTATSTALTFPNSAAAGAGVSQLFLRNQIMGAAPTSAPTALGAGWERVINMDVEQIFVGSSYNSGQVAGDANSVGANTATQGSSVAWRTWTIGVSAV
jgi:hypothetical protein